VTRFLALGDSYTIGEGVADAERWPDQLVARLRDNGIVVTDLHIIARTAWTTDELSDAIDAEKPKGPFDLVTLMIGVNDQYRSRPVREYESEFQRLLKRAVGFSGNRATKTLALSIPDWGATPFSEGRDRALIGGEIAAYNACGETLATKAGVTWIDVTEASRAMQTDPDLVAVDGLHPTAAMYARWVDIMVPYALAALRS